MTVKRRKTPRYGRITEGGHQWYIQSFSDFGSHPGQWCLWCEDCEDFHHIEEIDPLTMPDATRAAFLAKEPTA